MNAFMQYVITLGILLILRVVWDWWIDDKIAEDENLEDLGW